MKTFEPGCSRRQTCVPLTRLLLLLAIGGLAHSARAEEDSAEDHGSRAARRAESETETPDTTGQPAATTGAAADGTKTSDAAEKNKKRKKKRKKARHASKKPKSPFSFDYTLGVFGGSYLQGGAYGPLLNASVGESYREDGNRASLELSYDYDPFSTKTFNFPEEEAAAAEARLTQGMHELALTNRLGRNWNEWFETTLRARADWWLPEHAFDERRSLRLEPEFRFGYHKGPYASVAADGFYKQFPNYEIADRRLDQRGIDSTLELGWDFGVYNRIAVGTALDYTEYLDARYDRLADDGTLQRATRSKRYLERAPFVFGTVRPIKQFRANARYSFELNDAIDYDRRMTGRIDGVLVAKFIPDYYDYRRHRVSLNTVTTPVDGLEFRTLSEVWFRDFDSYEARDVDNNWTGDLRHDFNLEAGLEVGYRIWEFAAMGVDHGLYISSFASHLHRRSNMKREDSIATNFDITRVFLGLELRTE